MVLSQELPSRRWPVRHPGAWLALVAASVVAAAVLIVSEDAPRSTSSVRGSGHGVTDTREVAPFTSLDLAGANTVVLHVGAPQSVAVIGDDDLVGRVTTVVTAGRLVVDDTGSFTTVSPMHVAVSVPTLDAVEISGAGTVTADGIAGQLAAVLSGDGTLDLHRLVATDVTARLDGAGTIRVHATETLDATLTGTGTIVYRGGPTVTTHTTGTGTVAPE